MTTMEIDTPTAPPAGTTTENEKLIKIHPLALIGISDHHTRVISGGSAIPPHAPVVGLLFGYHQDGDAVIVDAEEMEYPRDKMSVDVGGGGEGGEGHDHRAAILQKIELHQKVFPRHIVVGWYRVQQTPSSSSSSQQLSQQQQQQQSMGGEDMEMDITPTEDDLRMTQTEMTQYCSKDVESPLFVLMNAGPAPTASSSGGDEDADKKPSSSSTSPSSAAAASAAEEIDEQLPLSIYETLVTETSSGPSAVFVNVEFELETYEPERIAVEKVFKTQPAIGPGSTGGGTASSGGASGSGGGSAAAKALKEGAQLVKEAAGSKNPFSRASAGGKKSKKDQTSASCSSSDANQGKDATKTTARGPSELEIQLESLQSSIRSMNARMNVLLEFLRKVEKGEIPAEDSLLRSVDGLLQQFPLVVASLEEASKHYSREMSAGGRPVKELENEYNDTMLLSYLAAVAKTAKTVHLYSEKFRGAYESVSSSRDIRRTAY